VADNMDVAWNWFMLSNKARINDVVRHPSLPWDWYQLTTSELIPTWDMVKHPNFNWDFRQLGFQTISEHEIAFLRTFRDRLIFEDWVDHTRHAPWKYIKTNLDLPWVSQHIAFGEGDIVTPHDIECIRWFMENGDVNFENASHVADIDMIVANMDLPWDVDIVKNRDDEITWDQAKIIGDMTNYVVKDYNTLVYEWDCALAIQKAWRLCISCPQYKICKKRLEKEFNTLVNINVCTDSIDTYNNNNDNVPVAEAV
jgi:hypothetical protein